jgi:galactokinase/mevalonate kinase-like predicted kinase
LLGRALTAGQVAKYRIPGMVTAEVADAVERITSVIGVRGCKVAGAGGGGHIVVACEPDQAVRDAIVSATGLPVITVEADRHGVRSDGWM